MRAPVDHAVAPVEQAFVPQPHEYFATGSDVFGVERKALPAPVAGAADDLELLDDGAAGLADVFPRARDECLATQVEARLAFSGEPFLDDILRRDAGVIRPRQPLGGAAAHPLEPDQHILDDVVQRVPDM